MDTTGNSHTSLLHHTTPHIYWLSPDARTDRPILGAISGKEATLIVDAGNSPAHARLFMDELSKVSIAPLRFVVLTHWHWDHVFGTAAFDLPTFASFETRQKVTEMAILDWSDEALDRRVSEGSEIVICRDNIMRELPDRSGLVIRPPEIGFSARLELDLGGVTCHIDKVGGDHDAGSTIIYVQEDRFMFISDCLAEDYYSGEPSYTVEKFSTLIDRLFSYDADYYLEGHTVPPASRQKMKAETDLIRNIGREVERIGQDREAILSSLSAQLKSPLTPDQLGIIDAFIAGLRKIDSSRKVT